MGIRSLFRGRRNRPETKPAPAPAKPVSFAANPPDLDPHTLTTFDQALGELMSRVKRMGEHVGGMVAGCGPVFLAQDLAKARELIQADLKVDAQKDELMSRTLEVLARHRPVASDLRLVLAVEHIAIDLERSADHAKNIAKRSLSLPSRVTFDPSIRELIQNLHSAVTSMFNDSLTAFITRNAALAHNVSRRDQLPDSIYDDMFHAVIARIQLKPANAATDVQALFVGKSLERIGDHATNISEEVTFLTRGDIPASTRKH